MKKLLTILCSLVMVSCLAGTALAIPTTWTELLDWGPDIKLTDSGILGEGSDHFDYYHDLGTDGFLSAWEVGGDDIVTSYQLEIGINDDSDRKDEIAWIIQPGLTDPDTITSYDFSLDFATIGATVAGVVDIMDDGTLNIRIEPVKGDFFLDYSEIRAYGDNGGSAPVPEPSTMLLLGLGLAGFAGFRRFKKSN